MTDGDALYRAILARPEDDTPRLVYADWLEEHGRGEEAEFIRLDCWLEASSPGEPGHTEAHARREELRLWLQTHCPGPQIRLAGGLEVTRLADWWRWTYRGFPAFLNWKPSENNRPGIKGVRKLATDLEKAFEKVPSRWLCINGIALDELAELLRHPAMAALDRLTIRLEDQFGDEAARIIADSRQLQNLRGLSVAIPVGEAGAACLGRSENLGRLEWLSIDSDNLSAPAVHSWGHAEWLPNLRTLMLTQALNADAFEELCRLSPCPNLHTLDLSANSFPVSSWQHFARSKTFPQLAGLNLHGTDMSSGQMAGLASTNELRLTTLNLNSCAIGSDGVQALVEAPWTGTLRSLDLSNNLLNPTAIATLTRCERLAELQSLSLNGNPIDVSDLKAIAGSQFFHNLRVLWLGNCAEPTKTQPSHYYEFLKELDLPHLRHLDLSDMPIGAKAARLLAGEKFHTLTRLGLANCKLTDAAIADLINSPSLQNLIELRLDRNNLKVGVAPLTDRRVMPRLSSCNLEGNPIAPELCRKLARRPGVTVPDQNAG